MSSDPRDYCCHGTYVGGCGIDWMCPSCELGIPDPSPKQLKDLADKHARDSMAALRQLIELHVVDAYEPIYSELLNRAIKRHRHMLDDYSEALVYAEDEDDTRWLHRKHDIECEEYGAQVNDSRHFYTEIDEIHEYGYVPD